MDANIINLVAFVSRAVISVVAQAARFGDAVNAEGEEDARPLNRQTCPRSDRVSVQRGQTHVVRPTTNAGSASTFPITDPHSNSVVGPDRKVRTDLDEDLIRR